MRGAGCAGGVTGGPGRARLSRGGSWRRSRSSTRCRSWWPGRGPCARCRPCRPPAPCCTQSPQCPPCQRSLHTQAPMVVLTFYTNAAMPFTNCSILSGHETRVILCPFLRATDEGIRAKDSPTQPVGARPNGNGYREQKRIA